MTKLKLVDIDNEKPVKITIELPADINKDLRTYAELLKRESLDRKTFYSLIGKAEPKDTSPALDGAPQLTPA